MKIGALLVPVSLLFGATAEIKVDQAGYLPSATKVALIVSGNAAGTFTVRDAKGRPAFSGKLSEPLKDGASGDTVRAADFSTLSKPGVYSLEVPGAGNSWAFEIKPGVYDWAWYLAMRSYYGQRCGMAVDLGPEFPEFKHAACHRESAFHATSGKTGSKSPSGGWHDAGDYGRYAVNSGISTGTLLWAYEMYSKRVGKITLRIPESGNGTPDILNEIRWNLDWMLTMQDSDGGVWQKQTSEKFPGFIMPEQDTLVSYVIGTGAEPYKSSCATADLAAAAAIASRVFKPFDAVYSAATLAGARKAWNWLGEHPNVTFRNPPGISTGAYGDNDCSDERLWAAAELWRTTGDIAYGRYFTANYAAFLPRAASLPSWNMLAPMALWTYALGGGDSAAVTAIRRTTLEGARQVAARASANPYRIAMLDRDYNWGSNAVAANYGMLLLVANTMEPDKALVEAARDHLHYLLGRNTFSLSFVSGVGGNPMRHPHHRPSGAMGGKAWPGLLAGGPNGRKQDPAMRNLADGLPPARMYLDDQASYATNEVAINWNAPLVFLLAGVMQEGF